MQFKIEAYQGEDGRPQYVIVLNVCDPDERVSAQYVYDTVYRDEVSAMRTRRVLEGLPVVNLADWHEREPCPRWGN